MVILDSSIIIDALRKKKSALDLIEAYAEKEQIAITVINKYEILRGAVKKDAELVSGLISQFLIYDLEDSIVNEAVNAHKKLVEKGKMVNELDVLIAGIAIANNETLITKDKDFLSFQSSKIIVL
ncbi:MAG: type II toxin-antitoxin system VapC family toxin [Candidatus Bathyarchaeia archaeon]